jgi:exopolysaccharide production protein ExoZ
VLYHTSRHIDYNVDAPLLRAFFQFGHSGVDFFFVISGFIILFVHYADVGNPARFKRYANRRITRLFPTYWVALGLTVAAAAAGGHSAPSLSDLLLSVSLCPSHREPLLGIAWTLQFEFLFYAIFAVLILSRRFGLLVLTIWLCLVVAHLVVSLRLSWLPPQLYAAYDLEFFLGMGSAFVLKNYPVPYPRVLTLTGVLLFMTTGVLENVGLVNGYHPFSRLAYGVPAALSIIGMAAAERQRCLRVPYAMRALGAASYSIYLFQFLFIGALWQTLMTMRLVVVVPPTGQFVGIAITAIVGGVVMSAVIERPLIRFARERGSR